MIDIFTGIALVGAAVSTAAWGIAVAKLRMENRKQGIGNREQVTEEREKESIHHSTFYIHHSKFSIHTAAFVFFATIATLSAQKQGGGTNDPPRGGNVEWRIENVELRTGNGEEGTGNGEWGIGRGKEQIHHSQLSILHSQFSTVVPDVVDYAGPLMPTNMPPVTNLCFWGVSRGTNSVALGLAWPPAISFTNDCIDLYGSWRLSTNGWARLAEVDVSSAASNAVVELQFSSFPTNAMEETAFFAAADQSDSDSDGLSDAFESLVSGSSPSMQDTDGDGLPDGDEVVMGSSPSSSDTDGDGLSDSAEAGAVEVVPSPSWKGMYGTPENVWSATLNSDSGSFLVNLRHPYTVNGVVYSRACLCVDGLLYLLDPEYQGGPVYAQIWEPPSLAADELSQEHVTIAAFCADLQVRAAAWGSWAVCGTAYLPSGPATAIDIYNIGFNSEYMSQNPHLLSYQILLPSGEPNVVYLTYRPMTPSSYFAGRSPAIGVQLSALPPARPGEQYYNVSWTPSQDSFASMLGLKITIGTGTRPSSPDTDTDGFTDFDEVAFLHTDPNEPDDDTDSDGLPDAAELRIGSDPNAADTDCDGLGDLEEYILGTNPLQPDSDGDGMNDGWERRYVDEGFDPTVDNAADSNPNNDISADPDDDGLENGEECEWGTDPGDPDTDGDGVNDGAEVAQNSDPTDATDGGLPNTRIPVPFCFGDHSGSHSEKYRLTVTPVDGIGQTPASFSWLNEEYGECETKTALLKPGWKYEVRLFHAGTNAGDAPDYDYTLQPAAGSLPPRVVIEDPDSLFGVDDTSSYFAGAGKVATISVYAVSDVTICAPDESSWPEIEESRVLLDDEDLRMKITISPQLQTLAQCRQMFGSSLTIKTSGTCPAGVSVPIPDDATFVNLSGRSEMRISKTRQQLKALGLLPSQDEDGVNEMAVYDVGSIAGIDGSNLSDSNAFLALGAAERGVATGEPSQMLTSDPPRASLSESFLRAAGCEIMVVTYGGLESNKRQIMNQADILYYSGHGFHKIALLDDYGPSVFTNRWNRDLNCLVVSGCSILDVNDYNNNFALDPEDHVASPGKLWENVGPNVMLGYNYYAPADDGGVPARVAHAWVMRRGLLGDVDAWMEANAVNRAWNACAIVKGQKYVYFEKVLWGFMKRKKEIQKEDW